MFRFLTAAADAAATTDAQATGGLFGNPIVLIIVMIAIFLIKAASIVPCISSHRSILFPVT